MKATYTITYVDSCGESWDVEIMESRYTRAVDALFRIQFTMNKFGDMVKSYHVYASPFQCMGRAFVNYQFVIEVA